MQSRQLSIPRALTGPAERANAFSDPGRRRKRYERQRRCSWKIPPKDTAASSKLAPVNLLRRLVHRSMSWVESGGNTGLSRRVNGKNGGLVSEAPWASTRDRDCSDDSPRAGSRLIPRFEGPSTYGTNPLCSAAGAGSHPPARIPSGSGSADCRANVHVRRGVFRFQNNSGIREVWYMTESIGA